MHLTVDQEKRERYPPVTPLKQRPKEIMSLIVLAIIGMIVGYGIFAASVFAFTSMDSTTAMRSAAVGVMLGGLIGNISVLVFLVTLVHRLFF